MDDKPPSDPLIGTIIGQRYQIKSISEVGSLGTLYEGIDLEANATVGILVAPDAASHRRLQTWLGQAILSRGKDAILAAGHVDARHAYVVFSEAVLEYLHQPIIEEPPIEPKPKGFFLWRKRKASK